MKTSEIEAGTDNFKENSKRKRNLRIGLVPLFILSLLILSTNVTFAHCDTMDGPLIKDAMQAIGQNNVNYALKWVSSENETEIKNVFNLMMKVRVLSPEAKDIAEKYFFETLVRIHRSGEGVPFTGVKPHGTPIDEKILAADKSIEIGNLSPLKDMVAKDILPELTKRFDKVMSLKNFNVNNVLEGREYIEAYVQFFKFAEGEEEGHATAQHGGDGHTMAAGHAAHIPWVLSGLFFITTLLFGGLFLRKQ
ncbi:MAG: LysM domain-containing protein [Bacteroidetes bacterium]|nr:MAG: LysM domain-containing protein [Bacteroidota bacterium]